MAALYANEFSEISAVLRQNNELCSAILQLVDTQPMPGKVTEGGDRLARFRMVLRDLVTGQIELLEAFRRTEAELSRQKSIHASNNRVFPAKWAERLVRTQFSRFYNQAVMEKLLAEGQTECFVPHSGDEAPDSPCSRQLAGANHPLQVLYDRLIQSYADDNWTQDVKIPNHPNCTHVVTPAR